MGEKVSKTNAARLLDRAKIHYELIRTTDASVVDLTV